MIWRYRFRSSARAPQEYAPTDECAAIPGVGAMGFHYANPANLTDGVIDPTKPDILLYHLTDDGELKLGAASRNGARPARKRGTVGAQSFPKAARDPLARSRGR